MKTNLEVDITTDVLMNGIDFHKETYLDTYKAQGSQGYGGEYFGSNCEGCGVAVQSGKTGQEIYNENFYGGIFRD